MAQDLIDAVVSTLGSNAQVTTAFGDTWNQTAQTGIAKIFADMADQVPVPYMVLTEVGETYDYMMAVAENAPFLAVGSIRADIYAQSRLTTRQLGFAVAKALNDAPLAWPSENDTLEFRLRQASFMPTVDDAGPGVPVMFRRVLIFQYSYSGNL